ncbi:hypothetical protein SAMN05192574_101394 [Mucilaginibacter gossypiicola]|uniref:Uncharacterized protein n=1 Tax=Mucilaginibacter gossypiicola TaxID=551995 RepID=A0A1H8A9T2_9SPHI|nr:hypothetical protein [Mucilaginibacter gossypiicola]SEM66578.1 hypothetical protein SAMN05192574_101394 [Mucilaginibacter gossypiicola]
MLLRLQLISTGQFFVMAVDGALTIEINSTIFNNEDDFLGSLSYSGSLPLEDNRALIANAHFIATAAGLRELDVRMWLGNLPYKVTRFLFTIEDKTIAYNLLIDKGILAKDMSTRMMNQLYIPGSSGIIGAYDAETFGAFMLDTATAAPGVYPLVFFPIKNDGAYKEIDPSQYGDYPDIDFPVSKYMNEWRITSGVGSFFVNAGIDPKSQTFLPFFNLVYVLKQVLAFYGLSATGTMLNDPDIKRIFIYSQVSIDVYIVADYPTYMPAITVTEFLKTVRNRFGALIDQDTTRKICYVESLLYLQDSPETVDLRDKQVLDYREISGQATGYTITQPVDDKDDAFSDTDKNNLPKMVIGDGLTEITLADVATKMINEDSPATVSAAQWRIPYMKQPVHAVAPFTQIQAQEYADRNNFKLRFLYYHGMQHDAAGYTYPYGSTDNVDQAGTQLTKFTLSLTPSGTSYQSLQQKYTFLKNTKPFEMGFRLTKEEFLNLSVHKRYLIRDFNKATISCILSSFTADIADEQTVKAKLTLYPVVRPNNTVQIEPPPPDVPGPGEDNGTVYVKLQQRNIASTDFPFPPPGYRTYHCDLYAVFFEDAAATIPKTVVGLPVRYNITTYYTGGSETTNGTVTTTCNGTETELQHGAPISSNSGGPYTAWSYKLMPSAYYHILT